MAPTARSLGNARLSMLAKPRAMTTREDFAADIRREWTNALEATVAVGRRLNEAKEALPHGEYQAMVENDLPFSTSTARKLREIAAFVDRDQVPLDRLPEAMSTLYAIATLADETRQQALDAGTIHPAVTRAEVEALKAPQPAPAATAPDPVPAPLPLPLLERGSPAVSGLLVSCCVAVPELLLFRLEGVLEKKGMLGGTTITLRHCDEHLTINRRDQHYSIDQHFHDRCSYVGSTMSKTRVADFLRAWLAASAEPGAPPADPTVIDVEAVPVAEEPAVQLPPPPVTVKPPRESRFSVALEQRWETDPSHAGDILIELDGQRRVLLVMVAPDPAAADIVRHVVDLHNAALEG